MIEDVRIKNGKTRSERVVVYPELMAGFDVEYQKAKAAFNQPAAEISQPAQPSDPQ